MPIPNYHELFNTVAFKGMETVSMGVPNFYNFKDHHYNFKGPVVLNKRIDESNLFDCLHLSLQKAGTCLLDTKFLANL